MADFDPTPEQELIINPERWESSIITASAGSGKTSTIIRRAINQIEVVNDSQPWKHIAIISYTNKSKDDIRKQIKKLNGKNILSSTFHTFIMRHIFSFVPLFRNREVCFDFNHTVASKKDWCNYIKNNRKISKTQPSGRDYFFEYALHLIRTNENIRRYLKSKFVAIYIDEAQDNNEYQYNIVDEIVDLGIQVVMVGDPNQTIYQFRGSESDRFRSLLHNPRFNSVFDLTRNFRCHELINECANSYHIPVDSMKDSTSNRYGVFIRSQTDFYTTLDYFNQQGNEGLVLLVTGVNYNRNKFNREVIDKYNFQFVTQPLIVASSSNPYYLDLLFKLYFGGSTQEIEYIENMMPNIKRKVARDSIRNLKDAPSIDSLSELNGLVGFYSNEDFEEIINTFNSNEARRFYNLNPTENFAMTIHSAKGLEFDNVVIVGHYFNNITTEQDRNLFYVGCTRARKRLFFLVA